jgi:phosphoenolpyruvate carboxylase
MVGFSDGTKDGGFLAANWGIRQAKRRMTQVGRERNVRLVFFDGRGGPPARGGGNTHRFYRSRDLGIEQQQTHLTIQGQTISAQFGSFEAARYHVEQLLTPNLENLLFRGVDEDPPVEHHALMRDLAATAHEAYQTLRNHPDFLGFLERDSALPLFDYLTNASRPVSRHPSKGLELESLRAIPFVAAWTVQKMQILGFYGLGTALDRAITRGDGAKLRALYRDSRFFRALIGNAVMSLKKSRFDVSAHLARHPRYGSLWRGIRDEAERTERHILTISGKPQLLAEDPVTRRSIELREKLVLPLVLIVHDALARWNENRAAGTLESMEAQRARKLALKGIAAVINATRNAA